MKISGQRNKAEPFYPGTKRVMLLIEAYERPDNKWIFGTVGVSLCLVFPQNQWVIMHHVPKGLFGKSIWRHTVQFTSVAQSCQSLCDPMNCSTPGLPVHHYLLEFTQTHVHWVRDVIQPSHPRSSPSPTAPNPSQHHSLFQWVSSSHQMAKVLEFQL